MHAGIRNINTHRSCLRLPSLVPVAFRYQLLATSHTAALSSNLLRPATMTVEAQARVQQRLTVLSKQMSIRPLTSELCQFAEINAKLALTHGHVAFNRSLARCNRKRMMERLLFSRILESACRDDSLEAAISEGSSQESGISGKLEKLLR